MVRADGTLVVLVVDDDDDVRELAVTALADAGHHVIEAASGPDALAAIERAPDIDVLFTDVVMPRMDGFRLADAAKHRRPALSVIYATGFAESLRDPGERHGPILSKPYRPAQLEAAVLAVVRR